jgi:dienelactone hydrolase
MRSARWLALTPILVAASYALADPQAPAGKDIKETARALVRALAKEDFTAAAKDFDEGMKKALPGDTLEKIWRKVTDTVGAFREEKGTRTDKIQQFDVVYVSCQFEKQDLDVRIVFNADRQVSGLQFVPPRPKVPPKTPPYARPDAYRERDVTVESGEWKLPGTLTMPRGSGPFPGVVLVHGSGPNDRDEAIGPNKPFRDLAWGLAAKGIAVLRYDKRTRVYGAQLAKAKDTLTLKEETVDDALAAAALLRKQPGVAAKKVFVLGHSLGAVAGPQIGARDPELAGLILMAGCTRPLEDVIVEQIGYINSLEGPSEEARRKLEKLKKQAARVKDPQLTAATPASDLPLGIPAAYWLALRGYNPAAAAAKLSQPLLILQGGRDYQVTMADFEGWRSALRDRPNARCKAYANLNHLFMAGVGKAKPAEYMDTANNVAAEVIDDIAAWIRER